MPETLPLLLAALVLLTGAVGVGVMGSLTARLVNHALGQVARLTDTGAGSPQPPRTRRRT